MNIASCYRTPNGGGKHRWHSTEVINPQVVILCIPANPRLTFPDKHNACTHDRFCRLLTLKKKGASLTGTLAGCE